MLPLRILLVLMVCACSLFACGEKKQSSDAPDEVEGPTAPHFVDFETLDRTSFDRFIRAEGLKIVEFGGKNCGPCNQMRARLTALRSEMPDLKLGVVYWEHAPELFEDWGVTGIPATLVFDAQGNECARHVGLWDMDELKKAVKIATAV